MKKKHFFYLSPNIEFRGIRSFYEIYKKPMKNLKLANKIVSGETNIIVENFNNQIVEYVKNSKKNKNTKLILILTEFWNYKSNTLNCFDFKFFFPKLSILILFYSFSVLRFFKRNFYNKIFEQRVNKKYKKKIKQSKETVSLFFYLRALISWKRRYLNLLKVIPYADLIVTSHPEILKHPILKNKKKLYYPYLFKFIDKKKVRNFGFGGASSEFRRKFFKNLLKKNKHQIYATDLKIIYKQVLKNKFVSNKEKKNYFFYSLNPKKEPVWPYSSPLRYIDSITHGEIPVIFDDYKYTDSLSKNITLNCKKENLNNLYKNRYKIKSQFTKKIKKISFLQQKKYFNFKKKILQI